jgi:hypothetical protein
VLEHHNIQAVHTLEIYFIACNLDLCIACLRKINEARILGTEWFSSSIPNK